MFPLFSTVEWGTVVGSNTWGMVCNDGSHCEVNTAIWQMHIHASAFSYLSILVHKVLWR